MSTNQYPSDVQFAGLLEAATAAADAQQRHAAVLGKRPRGQDDSLIDTQLRAHPSDRAQNAGQLLPTHPMLQSSASVLFREPSEKSKKYSRPPLGKVYTELEMAPESFLRLQNAAKLFMLDDDHPERKEVVGHKKHSANNDVAKLKLWGCVEDFLNYDDNGTRFFGPDAGANIPDTPPRTFFWPEDKQKIVKRCMPLFRKMVTNERQRIYASETRKQDPSKTDKNKKSDATVLRPAGGIQLPQVATNGGAVIDQDLEVQAAAEETVPADDQDPAMDTTDNVKLQVNIVRSGNGVFRRLAYFTVSSMSTKSLSVLLEHANNHYDFSSMHVSVDDEGWFTPVIKVLLPDGLVRIEDDEQWIVALLSASLIEWMDAEMKVLIEVESV